MCTKARECVVCSRKRASGGQDQSPEDAGFSKLHGILCFTHRRNTFRVKPMDSRATCMCLPGSGVATDQGAHGVPQCP
eukprot:4885947-Heterocapsa_arctica.AAC.1